jgi:hypothetical protein
VVDDTQWEHNRNRGPPRPQTSSNNADIVRQIAILEKQGIIENRMQFIILKSSWFLNLMALEGFVSIIDL